MELLRDLLTPIEKQRHRLSKTESDSMEISKHVLQWKGTRLDQQICTSPLSSKMNYSLGSKFWDL